MELNSTKNGGFGLYFSAQNPRLKAIEVLKLREIQGICGLKPTSIKTRIETRRVRGVRESIASVSQDNPNGSGCKPYRVAADQFIAMPET